MSIVFEGLQAVRARIAAAARAAGRDSSSVRLIAVSKTFAAPAVIEAIEAGQLAFGESYVQEGVDKMSHIEALLRSQGRVLAAPAEWHFIGPIQSNKTRALAEHFDWVHSVDRLKVAQRLNDARPAVLGPLDVCLQVTIGGEDSKRGVPPEEAPGLAAQLLELPRLRLRGLMTIPRPTSDVREQRAQFRALAELRAGLAREGIELDTLSMGMSDDLEAAVAEGATMVRVGRAIFGERGNG
jgi:pyridoxal phosphate enzyme (YggS family)